MVVALDGIDLNGFSRFCLAFATRNAALCITKRAPRSKVVLVGLGREHEFGRERVPESWTAVIPFHAYEVFPVMVGVELNMSYDAWALEMCLT